MYLSFESNELSALDLKIVGLIASEGTPVANPAPARPALHSVQVAVEPEVAPAKAEEAPVKDTDEEAAAKAKAKKAKAEAERQAELAKKAEEEAEEEAEAAEAETSLDDITADADEPEGPTMADAVAAATKLVSSGGAPKVKEALGAVGAKRVSEIPTDQIAAFLAALDDAA